MREITQKWLEAAYLDIENISLIIQNDRLTGHVAFHAQQAIENPLRQLWKNLKSVYLKFIQSVN